MPCEPHQMPTRGIVLRKTMTTELLSFASCIAILALLVPQTLESSKLLFLHQMKLSGDLEFYYSNFRDLRAAEHDQAAPVKSKSSTSKFALTVSSLHCFWTVTQTLHLPVAQEYSTLLSPQSFGS